jgi:hypothetical protein
MNFSIKRGKIGITPTVVIDRTKFPTADDEYTPEQRRVIDARLDKADADIKAGRMSKASSDHQAFVASLHKETKKLRATKTKRTAK